jgi:hypothetical protein
MLSEEDPMDSVPTSRHVTFRHAFQVPGMERPHPPGTFELMTDIVELDVPWQAHRTNLTLLLPEGAHTEAWPISGDDLNKLIAADLQSQAADEEIRGRCPKEGSEAVPSVAHKRPTWGVDNGLPLLVLGFLFLVLFSVGAVHQLQAH